MFKPVNGVADITAIILAGGLGTRLRGVVPNKQKVMVEIMGRPFLTYLLDQLLDCNFQNVIFCTGYMSNKIEEKLGQNYKSLRLNYSKEKEPLGTGGALRLALRHINTEFLLVMNGDSFVNIELIKYLNWFFKVYRETTLLIVKKPDTRRYGEIDLSDDERILAFHEKGTEKKAGWINAGIYIIKKSLLASIPDHKPFSLEYDLFPQLVSKELYGFRCFAEFIDIGTPESYAIAKHFFQRITIHDN